MVDEDILKKSGADLFRELVRVYSTADFEDYFKAGIWKEDLVKADLQLIWAHRREAGAPDPPDIDDVPMPKVPKAAPMMGMRPVVPGSMVAGAIRPSGAITPLNAAIRPGGVVPGAAVANGATSGPAAELKLIALFIAKWKLDPTKAKMLLAKMTPAKRRYVITNFKNTTNAADPTAALEQYIAQCEKTNVWGAAVAAAATPGLITPRAAVPKPVVAPKPFAVPTATAAAALAGKRPITPVIMDPSKRPRITPPMQSFTPPAAKIGAPVRPVTPRPFGSAVRPPMMQPVAPRPGIRPVAPAGKGQEKPGNLIRSLLQKL
mmetsp:Transcript_53322/g.107048  ORF Transcript_53322/g.107048 Transcript_53322/m.107048 type:complete len:319 (-) Transcript_53322:100-1056(-)